VQIAMKVDVKNIFLSCEFLSLRCTERSPCIGEVMYLLCNMITHSA